MKGRLPNLAIIGAQKSATRWLRDVLDAHPDVAMAGRELEFFNHHYRRGLDWYASCFPIGTEHIAGEATPGYMMWTDDPKRSAARIDGCLPDVRLLALLRNPVDRLESAFVHHARMGRLDSQRSLYEHVIHSDPELDPMGLVSGGWYARSLEPYVRRFGDRLKVLLQEDLGRQADKVYVEALTHLGVDTSFRPPGLGQVRHSNRADVDDDVLRAAMLTPEQQRELFERYFAQDVDRLPRLVNVSVDGWVPTSGG